MTDGLFAGRYELAELLGAGGMARVHRAQDTRMGRVVAIKTLLPELAGDPDARRRFAREAQAAGALNHPGIVTVHDQDEIHDGEDVVPYLVMEYVRGGTLAQVVRQQAPLEIQRAVRITCDILDALAHAHRHGTVHRDVKPANVMITTEGVVKVADFGIARVLHTDARLTTTGSAIGTPSYMSPEQINGAEVDARSDVYSAGCVLTELLTGRPPFIDGNAINLMYRHVHTAPPAPSTRNPLVPGELDALVLTALAKDPAARHFDAAVFSNRLRAWLTSAGSGTPTGPDAAPAADRGLPAGGADPVAAFGTGAALPGLTPFGQFPAGHPPPPSTPPSGTPVRDATAPPAALPEHPAYRTPWTPPPPWQPGNPPPPGGLGGTAEPGAARKKRRRWIAAACGVAVAGVAVSVTLALAPDGHGNGHNGPPTSPPATGLRQAALTMHGGKEGSGYGGGLDGVVRPSGTKGGTLELVADSATDDILDPAATYNQPSWSLQRLFLRKLVDYAPRPGAGGHTVVPDLATDTGQVSPDGLTWTFHLKHGVEFDTGATITSKDVKYGVERGFASTVFPGGPTYFPELLDQGQHYPGPYKDTDPDRLGLRSVTTPDDGTVVFHLAKPFADFRYVLALSIGAPVPRSADTGDGTDFRRHPVGSGPYKVADYVAGKSLHMVRNPNWDQSTDTVHSALPDAIDFKVLESQDAVEAALLAGTADLDLDGINLSDSTETKVLGDPQLKKNADLAFLGTTRYLSLQLDVAPFDRYECRWAVQYAVDRAQLRAVLGGQYDGGDVATTMLPPTVDGYSPTAIPFGTKAGRPYPAEAKKYLAKCGRPGGFTVTLAGPSGAPRVEDAMQSVRQSLAEVGITVKVTEVNTDAFYDTLLSPAKLKASGWGMVMTGWSADWPTGGGFLRALVQPGGTNNYSGLNDSDLNTLVDKADATADPGAAASRWQAVDAEVMRQSTMVPLIYARHLVYRGSRLTNVYEHQVLGGVDLTALGVRP